MNSTALLYLFPDGEGLRLIWKPGWDWRAALDEIEAHPLPWPGPRSPDALEQAQEAWRALSSEEVDAFYERVLAALDAQERQAEVQVKCRTESSATRFVGWLNDVHSA